MFYKHPLNVLAVLFLFLCISHFAAAAPNPTSLSPTQGTTPGDTYVTITGSGFTLTGTTRVTFGGVDATNVVVSTSTRITCYTPAHAAGLVDVTVVNPDSTSGTLTNGFTYKALPAPTLTSITPNMGALGGGVGVTVHGTNFQSSGTTRITFGGVDATTVLVFSSTLLLCDVPAHGAGLVDVSVINPDGQSATLTNGFTYTAPTPTSVTPNSGSVGANISVSIYGPGFQQTGVTRVTFGGLDATNVNVELDAPNNPYITCTVPAHGAGAVDVIVINPDGATGTLTNGFTYVAAIPPSLISLTPTLGSISGGTAITLSGANFNTSGTTRVTFGGVNATSVTVLSNSTITCRTPSHSAGAVDVTVINPDTLSSTLSSGFTYLPLPVINSVEPPSGPELSPITLHGRDFSTLGIVSVTFDGIAATNVMVVNATTIQCRAPLHADGAAAIVVTNPDGKTASATFEYTPTPAPSLTGIMPANGLTTGGTPVMICGANFAMTGAIRVTFGGVEATGINQYSNKITCIAPAHAAGSVDVVVINPNDLSGKLTSAFTYRAPSSTIIHVDANNTSGTQNGAAWATAFSTIQAGITAVTATGQPGEVWVAEGTYTSSTAAVVVMAPFCDIYGGFEGSETAREQRDIQAHACIIDGANVRACVYGADNARLDGFTITRGKGDFHAGDANSWKSLLQSLVGGKTGLAVDNSGVSPTIANCIIRDNAPVMMVMANLTDNSRQSSPIIMGCTFENNIEDFGTIMNGAQNNLVSRAWIQGCSFAGNTGSNLSVLAGFSDCSPIVTDCIFDNNISAAITAGIAGFAESMQVSNCIFSHHPQNTVTLAVMGVAKAPCFSNCTFVNNPGALGVFVCESGTASASLTNCIAWGNGGPLAGTNVAIGASYCDVQGGCPGAGNINANPLFNEGTYKIRGESPCVDAGTAVSAPAADLRGISRPQFGGVDMGAYECTVHANFTNGPYPASEPGSVVEFVDTSVSTRSAITSRAWTFGDSATANIPAPSHSYAVSGSYTVSLSVASADDAATSTRTLNVLDDAFLSIATQPAGGAAILGRPYSLSIQTAGGFGAIHYQWMLNGKHLGKGDSPVYEIAKLTEQDAGSYTCEVSDDYDSLISDAAEVVAVPGVPAAGAGALCAMALLLLAGGLWSLRHASRRRRDA